MTWVNNGIKLLMVGLAILAIGACDSDDENSTTYVTKYQAVCSTSTNSSCADDDNTCQKYTGSVSYTNARQVDATDTTTQAQIDAYNQGITDNCAYSAQISSLSEKWNGLASKLSTCLSLAQSGLGTAYSYVQTQNAAGKTVTQAEINGLVGSSIPSSSGGTDCSTEVTNFYADYITRVGNNGTLLSNSTVGCSYLTSTVLGSNFSFANYDSATLTSMKTAYATTGDTSNLCSTTCYAYNILCTYVKNNSANSTTSTTNSGNSSYYVSNSAYTTYDASGSSTAVRAVATAKTKTSEKKTETDIGLKTFTRDDGVVLIDQ